MIKVLIVDDHELVRHGIHRLLDDVIDISVVGEAGDGETALALTRQHKPDVILMDITMPGIGGVETTRKLLRVHPDCRIIGVSVHIDGPCPARMLEVGAAGYLTKGSDRDEMVRAIRAVAAGGRYIGADVAQQMVLKGAKEENPIDTLSARELEVMLLVSQGHKLKHISDQLCLSPKTVSTYRTRIFRKLSANSDVELARMAFSLGLLPSQPPA